MIQSFQWDELRLEFGFFKNEGVDLIIHVEDICEEEADIGRVVITIIKHAVADAEHIDYVPHIHQHH